MHAPSALSKGPGARAGETDLAGMLRGSGFAECFADLCRIDPAIGTVIDGVFEELLRFDDQAVIGWRRTGSIEKLGVYALHYAAPLHSMLAAHPDERAILCAQLLSCMAWRSYDDCIDGHTDHHVAHHESLIACLRLTRYVGARFDDRAGEHARSIGTHYAVMRDQAVRERMEPIPVREIWRRCSLFVFAPESLGGIDAECARLFRDYLNYTGLAHDLSDLMSDIATGVRSLPLHWLGEEARDGVIDARVMERVYQRARDTVQPIAADMRAAGMARRFPVMHHLLARAATVYDAC